LSVGLVEKVGFEYFRKARSNLSISYD